MLPFKWRSKDKNGRWCGDTEMNTVLSHARFHSATIKHVVSDVYFHP